MTRAGTPRVDWRPSRRHHRVARGYGEVPLRHLGLAGLDATGRVPTSAGRSTGSGTTYVETARLIGLEMKMTSEVVEVAPLRLYREHSDTGPMDATVRFEPDGEATRLIMEMDHAMPGKVPGFIKDLPAWKRRLEHMTSEPVGCTRPTSRRRPTGTGPVRPALAVDDPCRHPCLERGAPNRGPHPGRRDRAEPLADPARAGRGTPCARPASAPS
jgi:hypothetical protein